MHLQLSNLLCNRKLAYWPNYSARLLYADLINLAISQHVSLSGHDEGAFFKDFANDAEATEKLIITP